jgi:type I restriction enzyme S subunit
MTCTGEEAFMTPEAKARQTMDTLLAQAGWHVCNVADANIHAARGVAIREFPLNTGFGFADDLLYIDAKAAGVIEAKKEDTTLIGVEVQSTRYAQGLPGCGPCPSVLSHRHRNPLHQRAGPHVHARRKKLQLLRADERPGRINTEQLLGLPVAVLPIEQQREIVAELEKQFARLDEAVANLQRVKVNLKRYKASVLKDAVEDRLVPTEAELARREGRTFETGEQLLQRILEERRSTWTGPGKFRTPDAPALDSSELPEGWTWSSIAQLAEVGTGATPNRSKAEYWTDGDVLWVTSGVANGDYVDKPSEFVTQRALAETNLTLYLAGTLLVAMYGEGKTRGKCAELRIPATTNQALTALQVSDQVRAYVRYFLELNYEEMRKAASGGVQPNLNLSLVRAVAVPLPPLAVQVRIVAEVDRSLSLVRGVEAEVDANLGRAQSLRQATLAYAFRGIGVQP